MYAQMVDTGLANLREAKDMSPEDVIAAHRYRY